MTLLNDVGKVLKQTAVEVPSIYRALRGSMQASASDTGYSVPGSRRKAMKGWRAKANSPLVDVISKLLGTRAASRDLSMNSPLTASILDKRRIHDIGAGLQYQSRIDANYLGLTTTEADMYQASFEREFDLWAASTNSDFDGINTFYGNQALGLYNMFLSGDYFYMPVYRESQETGFPYQTCIKLIDADLVRDPKNISYGRKQDIAGGVEYDTQGRLKGFHVWNTYTNEMPVGGMQADSMFVPVFDSSGRRQIHHVLDTRRIKQRRGVALLAPAAESAKQFTRLSEATLMNMLVASLFTVFVRDSSGMGATLSDAYHPAETVTGGGTIGPDDENVYAKEPYDENDLELGYGNVVHLDQDKDVSLAERKQGTDNFGEYWEGLGTLISAVGGVPFERASMRYQTSYTAAKAVLNDAWQGTKCARALIDRSFNAPIVDEVIAEGIIRSRLKAPGFFDDYATRKAWLKSVWIGSGQGYLDPLREAKAGAIRINNFVDTHEQIYASTEGGRWDSAMERRANEQRLIEEKGLVDKPDPTELIGPDGQEDDEEQEDTQ